MVTDSAEDAAPDAGAGLDAPAPQSHFGDYKLLEEIACGGMGVVYRARQVSLILIRVQVETNYPGPGADAPHPIVIGSGEFTTILMDTWHDTDFAATNRRLQVEVRRSGSSDQWMVLDPRQQMCKLPQAAMAGMALTVVADAR